MAFYKQDIVDINLNTGNIFRSFLPHSIGYKDDDADRFGIRAFRDGEPVDLSGVSCQAIFMNPNGTNIALTSYGTVSGNVAYVTLPPACYDYEGQFCLAIKLVGGGVTGTVRIVDGTVTRTGASGAVAPTASVPTYQEILSTYDAMVAATSAANLAIAETFDATKAYPAGKYVINEGHLYRLTADHAANVTWANTSKVATNFGDDLTELKSALNESDDMTASYLYKLMTGTDDFSFKWAPGQINGTTGLPESHGTSAYTNFIPLVKGITLKVTQQSGSGFYFYVAKYDRDRNFISKSGGQASVSESGSSAAFIRLTVWPSGSYDRDTIPSRTTITATTDDSFPKVNGKISELNEQIGESDFFYDVYEKLFRSSDSEISASPSWENGSITNGAESDSTKNIRTGYIPVIDGVTIKCIRQAGYNISFFYAKYDKDKNYISGSGSSLTVIEIEKESGVQYVRIVGYSESVAQADMPGKTVVTVRKHQMIPASNASHNLLNKMVGGSISSGVIIYNDDSVVNCINDDFIPVDGGAVYDFNFTAPGYAIAVYFAQYNASKEFIRTDSFYTITNSISGKMDNNARFVRILLYRNVSTGRWSDWCPQDIVFTASSYPAAYVKTEEITDYVDPDKIMDRLEASARVVTPKHIVRIPGYYFNGYYLQNKVTAIRNAILGTGDYLDVFFFITDMHWTLNQKHSPALINYIYQSTPIPKLFDGGDNADGFMQMYDVLKSAYPGKVYPMAGNHEYFNSYGTGAEYLANTMPLENIKSGDSSRCYYYFDDGLQKTRYIILAAYKKENGGPVIGYEQAQLDWLNGAMNVEAGWKIIIFTHFFMNTMTGSIMSQDAYNLIEQHQHNGDVVAIIEGHQHFDGVIRTATGIPVIGVTCDKNMPWINSDTNMEPWLDDRTTGTIKEQAFDVMIVNHSAKTITQYRIGCPIRDGTDPETWTEMESRTISYDR